MTPRQEWMHKHHALVTNIGLVLFGLCAIQLCRDGVREFDHYINGYSMDVLLQILLYSGGALLVFFGARNRWTLRIILGVALCTRLVGVTHPQFLSTDIYRYVWDGRMQSHLINPYRYFPADPALKQYREDDIYDNINRKEYAHTIYPPGAQMIFFAITRIAETEVAMKLGMLAFEALAIWALMRILSFFGRPREEIILYAWHPLCIWEIGSSGHIDAAAVALLSLAALARVQCSGPSRNLRTAFWVTAAALVKLYPIVLFTALVRNITGRVIALSAAMVLVSYAIYSSVGKGVFGFLGGYEKEEGLSTGMRYFFLAFANKYFHVPLWPRVFVALVALALLTIAFVAWRRAKTSQQALGYALLITVTLTCLFSPHYPWYFLWVLPFAVALRNFPAIVLTLNVVFWYSTDLALPGPLMFRMNEYLYAITLAALLLDLAARWWLTKHGTPAWLVPLEAEYPAAD